MDASGHIRANMEVWMNNSCVKCACVNATVNCTRYDVEITYGLFKVKELPTCEHCVLSDQTSEALSACKGKFSITIFIHGF